MHRRSITALMCSVVLVMASYGSLTVSADEPKKDSKPAAEKDSGKKNTDKKDSKEEKSTKSEEKPAKSEEKPESKTPKTAAQWREQAEEEADGGNFKAALEAMNKAAGLEPDNRKLQWKVVELTEIYGMSLEEKEPKQANEQYLKAASLLAAYTKSAGKPKEGEKEKVDQREGFVAMYVSYNEAKAEAAAGHKDRAVSALTAALDAGWQKLDQLQEDEAFATLRETPEYKKLIAAAIAKMEERAKQHAEELLAEGTTFKFDFELPNIEDKPVKLKDFAGKVVIVDFWGTWCPPCRMEIPHFVALHKKYNEKGLAIVGLNFENGKKADKVEKVKEAVDKMKIPYPCLIGDEKTSDQVPDLEGFPTTLFLDRTGKVRAKIVGYHPMVELEAIVAKLLAEK